MMTILRPETYRRCAAFTLMEAIIAMAVLQTSVLAVVYTLTAGAKQADAGDQVWRAAVLAEDLMEEIVCLAYADATDPGNFGLEPGESTRADMDDIDDYHGFVEEAGFLVRLSGTAYPDDFQNYARSVTVENVTQNFAATGHTISGRIITVTVTKPDNQTWVLQRFMADAAQGGG